MKFSREEKSRASWDVAVDLGIGALICIASLIVIILLAITGVIGE